MVKLFSTEHTFFHPFERVTSAFWRKYPNEHAAHIKGIDCFSRHVDSEGRLVSHRIMSCESPVPGWLSAAGLPSSCFAAEVSVVDPRTQTMVVKSRNLTGASLLQVEETCTYSAVPASTHTHYTQSAKITAFLPFLSGKFEQYSLSNLSNKSAQGLQTIENLCQRIQHHGVLSCFDSLAASISTPAPSPTP